MPIEGISNISESIDKLIDTIPGPQDGESIVAYKSRVNADAITIFKATINMITEVDALIENRSDDSLVEDDQFYSATQKRFVGKN